MTIKELDPAEINQQIAFFYNEGVRGKQIAEKIEEYFGVQLTNTLINSRIRRMKNNGTLQSLDLTGDDKKMLDEIFGEIGDARMMRAATFDTESNSLYADFGYLFCACFFEGDVKTVHKVRLDETDHYKNMNNHKDWDRIDEELCVMISDKFNEFDFVLTYNGRMHDMPFVNTRLTKYGLPLLAKKKHVDLLQIARYKLKLTSNRADRLYKFLGISDGLDTHDWVFWQMASGGKKEGFDYVVKHCTYDVLKLGAAARRMQGHIDFVRSW